MAGLIKTQVQLGDSATATQNFVLTSAAADGTMKLARGNYGATSQDIITVAADGNVQLTKTGSQSLIKVNTSSGYGSTNTAIRRFSNITNGINGCIIQGTDITFTDSATLGSSFTINTNGVYAISAVDLWSTPNTIALTVNDSTPTSATSAIALTQILAAAGNAANIAANVSWTGYLVVGSIIRIHTDGAAVGTAPSLTGVTIVRVS